MLKVFCSCEDQLRPICIIKVPCTISLNNMQKDWDVFLYSAMYIEQKQLRRHRFLPVCSINLLCIQTIMRIFAQKMYTFSRSWSHHIQYYTHTIYTVCIHTYLVQFSLQLFLFVHHGLPLLCPLVALLLESLVYIPHRLVPRPCQLQLQIAVLCWNGTKPRQTPREPPQ